MRYIGNYITPHPHVPNGCIYNYLAYVLTFLHSDMGVHCSNVQGSVLYGPEGRPMRAHARRVRGDTHAPEPAHAPERTGAGEQKSPSDSGVGVFSHSMPTGNGGALTLPSYFSTNRALQHADCATSV